MLTNFTTSVGLCCQKRTGTYTVHRMDFFRTLCFHHAAAWFIIIFWNNKWLNQLQYLNSFFC